MYYLKKLTLLALLQPLSAYGKSLYIDKSCKGITGFDVYLQEAQTNAKRSVERMDSKTDTDFEAIFKRIFKTEKGSDGGKYVRGTLDGIINLKPTDDLKGSDIRLFCDNDARWVKKESGGFYDPINDMVHDTLVCQSDKWGRCYQQKAKDPPTDPQSPRYGHNPNRYVISICNAVFDNEASKKGYPLYLNEKFTRGNLGTWSIELLALFASRTILHELIHAISNGEIIDQTAGGGAYLWKNIIVKDAESSRLNADNYVYLSIWATLADLGYTLERLTGDLTEDDKKRIEDDAKNGKLKAYKDITKRGLLSSEFYVST
ncbi:hypothetical protein B0J11DRAFT_512614 [Dendryphion nanum]|uniref:Lysine-specific metallo-endopeptidase domain-containing protein n=1 Tax=Dendryphion nanum TaxID=256645 RepID=A0A9P9I840_9PLEO|nr:hypothetical protein B0J11DRAFT_512614 [Dendryphion nanum]